MKKDREHIDPLANWTESIKKKMESHEIHIYELEMLDKIRVERRKAKIKRLMGL